MCVTSFFRIDYGGKTEGKQCASLASVEVLTPIETSEFNLAVSTDSRASQMLQVPVITCGMKELLLKACNREK